MNFGDVLIIFGSGLGLGIVIGGIFG